MAKEAFVFEVSDSNYGKYVLVNSHRTPVVVAFVGVWSGCCMAVTDLFAGLTRESIVNVINMLAPGNPEFAQQDRRKLSSMRSL